MDVSAVIVTFNGRDLVRRCLASVFAQTSVDLEVIVVDNASTDGTPELVAREFPQARLVRRASNGGFAVAANEGLAAATAEAFLLLNPDAELCGDVLARMLTYLRAHPEVAVLAPRLVDEDGSLQLSCRAFPSYATALFNRYSFLTRLLPGNRFSRRYLMSGFDHASIADVDWASAACWLLARHAYERVGPLDERYFWTFEDVDYAQRVRRAGLRVVYFPEAVVRHRIGGSASTLPARAVHARHDGMWRYYRDHLRPSGPAALPLDALAWCAIQTRRVVQLAASAARRRRRR